MQRAEQQVGHHVGVGIGPLRRDEAADVVVPEPVDRMLVALPGHVVRGGALVRCNEQEIAREHRKEAKRLWQA